MQRTLSAPLYIHLFLVVTFRKTNVSIDSVSVSSTEWTGVGEIITIHWKYGHGA